MESKELVENSATADTKERGLAKTREGLVTSNKMNKTVVFSVSTKIRHKAYGKYVRRTNKYLAHDERNECQVGDRVLIVETRPLSRNKRWRVRTILEKAI